MSQHPPSPPSWPPSTDDPGEDVNSGEGGDHAMEPARMDYAGEKEGMEVEDVERTGDLRFEVEIESGGNEKTEEGRKEEAESMMISTPRQQEMCVEFDRMTHGRTIAIPPPSPPPYEEEVGMDFLNMMAAGSTFDSRREAMEFESMMTIGSVPSRREGFGVGLLIPPKRPVTIRPPGAVEDTKVMPPMMMIQEERRRVASPKMMEEGDDTPVGMQMKWVNEFEDDMTLVSFDLAKAAACSFLDMFEHEASRM
ncbi:hypothetical protein HDU67_010424 [Dinochytrium kinnereticum]|nr:hypothetical protein HDU67_010424 [Dinochytrium kinnereticum]